MPGIEAFPRLQGLVLPLFLTQKLRFCSPNPLWFVEAGWQQLSGCSTWCWEPK